MPPQNLTAESDKKVEDLLKRVEALEEWRGARESQQLTYPLDYVSQQIIAGVM